MFVTFILSRIRAYRRYRETVRELMQFSDRELDYRINHFVNPSSSRWKESNR